MTEMLATPFSPSRAVAMRERLFEALSQYEGKAEIIGDEIVPISPTQPWPNEVAGAIYMLLRLYAKATGTGLAVTDNATFRVDLSDRQSFSPDAAFHTGGVRPMKYYEGAPMFAVEVRSAGDYGSIAEQKLAKKRSDYFACGTPMVWDVDLLSSEVIRVYRATSPAHPTIYRAGDIAEAEPAVPGWTVAVNEILPEDWAPPAEPKP